MNTYGYVGGNPLYWIDRSGLAGTAVTTLPTTGVGSIKDILNPGKLNPWVGVPVLILTPSPLGADDVCPGGICPPGTWHQNENANEDGSAGEDGPKQCDDKPKSNQRGNPPTGEPNTWAEHPHGKQDRLYGKDGRPAVDIDYGHDHGQGSPHAHNWDDGVRGPGVPVTVLPK